MDLGIGLAITLVSRLYIRDSREDVADRFVDNQEQSTEKDRIKLYGHDQGLSWVARPVIGHNTLRLVSRHGSIANQSVPLIDSLDTLFGNVHEKFPGMGSTRSMLFSNMGNMFSMAEHQGKNEQWDEKSLQRDGDDYGSDVGGESDDNLQSAHQAN